ncbi:hypothetical protein AAV98_12020 [Bacillus sp. CHD6a]|nr:hypothetical protein AAV98_12020 [Bacillus sp. CHD6a]
MPLGKRSHLRKSTAVFSEISKSMSFSVASGVAEEAPAVPLGKRSNLRKGTEVLNQTKLLLNIFPISNYPLRQISKKTFKNCNLPSAGTDRLSNSSDLY